MPKKIALVAAVFTLAMLLVWGCLGVAAAGSPLADQAEVVVVPAAIQDDSPCPATGCASGECHGFDDVPEPDGVHEMVCPEAGCASLECHAYGALTDRYRQASDASLNIWIILPVAVVIGLVLIMRKVR